MSEFNWIEKYFLPLAEGRAESGAFQNDAAVLSVPDGQELIVTTDMLNEGVHFPEGAEPLNIAAKALRANLSDLAAMGAKAYCYQLALALPQDTPEDWIKNFSAALQQEQKEFGIFCSGGDTTSTAGSLSISITAFGLVPRGQAVSRNEAQEGDVLLLSGPVGDAFIGLEMIHRNIDPDDYFTARYYKPVPRFDLIGFMREYAHASIDISDGLVADLGHICVASNVLAQVELEKITLSPAAQKLRNAGKVTHEQLLSGGDDYELLIATPPEHAGKFPGCSIIGEFMKGEGVSVIGSDGCPLTFEHTGWSHF